MIRRKINKILMTWDGTERNEIVNPCIYASVLMILTGNEFIEVGKNLLTTEFHVFSPKNN